MSLWSRIANVLRGDGLSREIDEELQSHIAEADRAGSRSSRGQKSVLAPRYASATKAATSESFRGSTRSAPTPSSAGAS